MSPARKAIWIAFVTLILYALLGAAPVYAQAAPAVRTIHVAPGGSRQLDSLASVSRETRLEAALCLNEYSVKDSVLTLSHFTLARYDSTDSVTIYAHAPLCPIGTPTVHSHVAYDGYPQPSEVDFATAHNTGFWSLILSVRDNGWSVHGYGLTPPVLLQDSVTPPRVLHRNRY